MIALGYPGGTLDLLSGVTRLVLATLHARRRGDTKALEKRANSNRGNSIFIAWLDNKNIRSEVLASTPGPEHKKQFLFFGFIFFCACVFCHLRLGYDDGSWIGFSILFIKLFHRADTNTIQSYNKIST